MTKIRLDTQAQGRLPADSMHNWAEDVSWEKTFTDDLIIEKWWASSAQIKWARSTWNTDASIEVDANEDLIINYWEDDLWDKLFFKYGSAWTTAGAFDATGNFWLWTASPLTIFTAQSSNAWWARMSVNETATGWINNPWYMIYNEWTFKGGMFYDEAWDYTAIFDTTINTVFKWGNVWIWTTSPWAKLEVNWNIRVWTAWTINLTEDWTYTSGWIFNTRVNTVWEKFVLLDAWALSGGNFAISSQRDWTQSYTQLEQGSAENITLRSSGNVWIGTTSPDAILTIWTNVSSLTTPRQKIIWASDTVPLTEWWDWWVVYTRIGRENWNVMYMDNANYGWYAFQFRWAGDYSFMQSGNVWIGTTTPWVKLDVAWIGRFSWNLIWQDWIFAQDVASATAWANECAFKSQNTSSGAIYSMRVDSSNNLLFEYFNWATWSTIKTVATGGTWYD